MKTTNVLFGIFTITLALSAQVQAQFNYTDNGNGTCTITGYTGAGGAVVIPTNINGLIVITIGSGNFEDAVFPESLSLSGNLISVTIPNSVTSINAWAFLQCSSLTGITIPNSVVSIGAGAFAECSGLTNFTFPNGQSTIGQETFIDCTSLTNITIPASVTSILDYTFENCYSLTSLYFLGNAPAADSSVFAYDNNPTAYYLAGTTGWSTFSANTGLPVQVWNGPAPVITAQPQSVVVNAYDPASFTVTASDISPLNYQWSLNGSNISGATSSILTIPNVVQTNLGTYAVVVTNALGAVTSSNAVLSMYPFLATPFGGLDTYWGYTNTLSVGAWGTGPLDYQWFDDGNAIDGATNQTLTLTGVQFTNAGLYSVVVTSPLGSVTNTPEQVVVNPAGVSFGGLYPSVIIQGVVGYNYVIQSTANLSDTNSWVTVTNLTLTQPIQLWIDSNTDASLPANPNRFYKVLPGQP
jgi:hypothetical protein